MTSRRAFWVMLSASAAVAASDAVFATVSAIVWPGPSAEPAWEYRVFESAWLAALLLAIGAGLNYAWRVRRKP